MQKDLYYTANDLKELYGLEQDAIRRLVIAGKLTECRFRNRTVFQKAQVLLLQPSDFLTTMEENQFFCGFHSQGPANAKKQDQFIRIHYTLINAIIKQYENQGIGNDELLSAAIEVMLERMYFYHLSNNERFSAVISREIQDCLRSKVKALQPKPQNENPKTTTPKAPVRPPVPSLQKLQPEDFPAALKKLEAIQDLSPRQMYHQLGQMGYFGQDSARRKLCLMAYRHVRRLKDHYLHNVPLNALPPKANVLMVGPTGCGKTHLANLLFGKIIGVPVALIDITAFTEVGYVGRDVSEILFDLERAASGNVAWAKMGICILDEFDKIAASGSIARFSGAGTTKDVSGYGVQRQLLKMIEGGKHAVSTGGPHGLNPHKFMETDFVGFLACGAFSGIKNLALRELTPAFGFNSCGKEKVDTTTAYKLDEEDVASVEIFARYGLMPELVGRFNSITTLSPLDASTLTTILLKNVIPSYELEFAREGLVFEIPQSVVDQIVSKAVSRRTGARGLALELTEYIERQAFESFGANRKVSEKVIPPAPDPIKDQFDDIDNMPF